MAVTSVWETWMIFNNNNVESWVKTFLGRTDEEERTSGEPVEQVVEKPVEKKGRWKSVVETSGKEAVEATGFTSVPGNSPEDEDGDFDGESMEDDDVDGMPMDEEDVDGEPMDDDVDGEPMEDEDVDGMPMEEPLQTISAPPLPTPEPKVEEAEKTEPPRPKKRQRMRAADMFTED